MGTTMVRSVSHHSPAHTSTSSPGTHLNQGKQVRDKCREQNALTQGKAPQEVVACIWWGPRPGCEPTVNNGRHYPCPPNAPKSHHCNEMVDGGALHQVRNEQQCSTNEYNRTAQKFPHREYFQHHVNSLLMSQASAKGLAEASRNSLAEYCIECY